MLCVFYRKYYVNCLDMTCNIDNFAAGKPEECFKFSPLSSVLSKL